MTRASLPVGWSAKFLGELALEVRNGISAKPDATEGLKILRTSAVRPMKLVTDDVRYLPEEGGPYSDYKLERNDLLFTRYSGSPEFVGVCARVVDKLSDVIVYPDKLIRVRVNQHMAVPAFIEKAVHWSPVRDAILAISKTSAGQIGISGADLKRIEIPLPPLIEQQRIADVLDKADAIRRKRREALALTDELLRATFLEMFGDPVTNPQGWPVVELGSLLTFLTSGSRGWAEHYADSGDLFIRIQNVRDDELDLDDVMFVRAPAGAEAERTRVRAGDVLLSITADLGRTAVVPELPTPGYINQHLAILRTEAVEPEYLSAFLASQGGRHQLLRMNRAAVKAGLNFSDIRGVLVPMPPRSLQVRYVGLKQRIRANGDLCRRGSYGDEALFAALQHRAFRGEL